MTSSEFAKVDAELLARGNIRMVFDFGVIQQLLHLLGDP